MYVLVKNTFIHNIEKANNYFSYSQVFFLYTWRKCTYNTGDFSNITPI